MLNGSLQIQLGYIDLAFRTFSVLSSSLGTESTNLCLTASSTAPRPTPRTLPSPLPGFYFIMPLPAPGHGCFPPESLLLLPLVGSPVQRAATHHSFQGPFPDSPA